MYGIEVDGQTKAYAEETILGQENLTDNINDQTILITNNQGQVSFINQETIEEIVPLRSFWFAWAAFHPDTQLFQTN